MLSVTGLPGQMLLVVVEAIATVGLGITVMVMESVAVTVRLFVAFTVYVVVVVGEAIVVEQVLQLKPEDGDQLYV